MTPNPVLREPCEHHRYEPHSYTELVPGSSYTVTFECDGGTDVHLHLLPSAAILADRDVSHLRFWVESLWTEDH
jgi:hypothetical protein